jgi:hypothetical protein
MDRQKDRERFGNAATGSVALLGLLLAIACDAKPHSVSSESKPGAELTKAPAAAHLLPRKIDESELSVFVIQDVSDAQVFLDEFRKNQGVRVEAGVVEHSLAKIVGDKNRFATHYRVGSAAKLKAFLDSQKYDSLLTESQATDSLLMWEAKNVLTLTADGSSKPGATLYKKFPVGDFKMLENQLSKYASELAQLGLNSVSLNQAQADASVAILQLRGATPAQLRAAYDGPLIQQILKSAGCRETSQPLIATDLPD